MELYESCRYNKAFFFLISIKTVIFTMTGRCRTSSKMELRTEFLHNQQCHSHQPSKFATLDPKSSDLVCLNRLNDDLYLVTCRLVQLAYLCNGQIKHHRHVLFVEVLIIS